MSDTNPLLNNFSVQGAAKSIEGILDPNTATIKPQKEATPVEPKETEAKAEDNQEVQPQPEALTRRNSRSSCRRRSSRRECS